MNKKWTILTLLITLIILICTIALVVVADPFFQYHKPISDFGYMINNQLYQNPGIAKHFDYNAILLGSSMTENFMVSQIDDAFSVSSVKLCYSGAFAKTIKTILDIAFENNDNIKKVFLGLDIYSYLAQVDADRYPLPEYLYDNNMMNDLQYVLNKDVIAKSTMALNCMNLTIPNTTRDGAYAWYASFEDEFNGEYVAKYYDELRPNIIDKERTTQELTEKVRINVQYNLLPIIEKNPDTEFYIFFPPYSILYWDKVRLEGDLEAELYTQRYSIESLLGYDNVKVYFFQDIEEIILNLNNYKDHSHYHIDINSLMVDEMSQDKCLLTENNYMDKLNHLYSLINETNIDRLLESYVSEDE